MYKFLSKKTREFKKSIKEINIKNRKKKQKKGMEFKSIKYSDKNKFKHINDHNKCKWINFAF